MGGANAEVSLVGRAILRVGPMTPIDEDVIILSVGGRCGRPPSPTSQRPCVRCQRVQYAASLYVQGQLVAEGSWQHSIPTNAPWRCSRCSPRSMCSLRGGTFANPTAPGLQERWQKWLVVNSAEPRRAGCGLAHASPRRRAGTCRRLSPG